MELARGSILGPLSVALFLGTAALATACFQPSSAAGYASFASSSNGRILTTTTRTCSASASASASDDVSGKKSSDDDDDDTNTVVFHVAGLQRYAVKGLSPDQLETVKLTGSSFPDDRRYALWQTRKEPWQEDTWLHKDNFLCAFTHPHALAQYITSYNDSDNDNSFTVRDRATGQIRLGPVALATEAGRNQLAAFVTQETGVSVQCITSAEGKFQFGNTSSATKNKTTAATTTTDSSSRIGDRQARCMHVVLQSTVDALAEKIGIPLQASRFRPNIILQPTTTNVHDDHHSGDRNVSGNAPFQELGWVGKSLQSQSSALKLKIISKTVRCAGVGVDPLDLDQDVLDIPALLMKHFPEHGPYLGVYCVLEKPGTLSVGDTFRLVES